MTHYGLPDVVAGPLFVFAGGLFLLFAWQFGDNARTMVTTTQSDAGTLPSAGTVEVSGRVHEVPDPLTAPLSGADCIDYGLEVEEYRRDDTATGHGIAKEWVDVDQVRRSTRFVLTDDTGTVTVDPEEVGDTRRDVENPETESLVVEAGDAPELEASVPETGDDAYRRRYGEQRLPAEGELYVLGTAADRGRRIDNREGEPSVVSTGGERSALVRQLTLMAISGVIGAGLAGGGAYVLLGVLGLQ